MSSPSKSSVARSAGRNSYLVRYVVKKYVMGWKNATQQEEQWGAGSIDGGE
jgi:hypothetical protein